MRNIDDKLMDQIIKTYVTFEAKRVFHQTFPSTLLNWGAAMLFEYETFI